MKKVFVAGHNGMVGNAICAQLAHEECNLITASRDDLNLLDQNSVSSFFLKHKFDEVYLAAAKVGGINANDSFPAEFIYENITIQNNIIHAAHQSDVNKLLFLGSSCIYPKLSPQPIEEEFLLDGKLEQTNEPYAISKIAGIKMCESYNRQYNRDYRSIMPTNLYGQNDNFHKDSSHVIPGMLLKFHNAKIESQNQVVCWGSGKPYREFLHVKDLAKASLLALEKLDLRGDTTFIIGLEAIKRGFEVFFYSPSDLIYKNNFVYANAKMLHLELKNGKEIFSYGLIKKIT